MLLLPQALQKDSEFKGFRPSITAILPSAACMDLDINLPLVTFWHSLNESPRIDSPGCAESCKSSFDGECSSNIWERTYAISNWTSGHGRQDGSILKHTSCRKSSQSSSLKYIAPAGRFKKAPSWVWWHVMVDSALWTTLRQAQNLLFCTRGVCSCCAKLEAASFSVDSKVWTGSEDFNTKENSLTLGLHSARPGAKAAAKMAVIDVWIPSNSPSLNTFRLTPMCLRPFRDWE